MGPQNGLIGDDYGTALPEVKVDEEQLNQEKKMAAFYKSSEYGRLKEHLEERIEYYQKYLPDGREVAQAPDPNNWVIANTVIREFKLILGSYEQAKEAVEDAQRKRA